MDGQSKESGRSKRRRRRKITLPVSIGLDCCHLSTKNFFYFKLFQHLMCSQVKFQPQWTFTFFVAIKTFFVFFFFSKTTSYQRLWNINIVDAKWWTPDSTPNSFPGLTASLCGGLDHRLSRVKQVTNGRRSGHLPAVRRQWKGWCWANQGCTVLSFCDGPLHSIWMLYYPDINGRQDSGCLLCDTKEAGSSVWRITWMDFCIHVCGCPPSLCETIIEGVHKHWSNADWAITWAHTGYRQRWSRTGGASCNVCADDP